MKSIFHLSGWLLVAAGAVGLLLPFVQGIALIALGVGLLSFRSSSMQKHLHELLKLLSHHWPYGARFLAALEQKCDTVLARFFRRKKQ